jgi:hypothetical protein
MVLRDSFLASEKVKIVMLTCICPGMRASHHTLNSLRYGERLKESVQGNQGMTGAKVKKQDQDKVQEDLRVFLERHGKSVEAQRED